MRQLFLSFLATVGNLCVWCTLRNPNDVTIPASVLNADAAHTHLGHLGAPAQNTTRSNDHEVLILGGGISGVMAARSLHRRGIQNVRIVEAREQLGGRLKSFDFGVPNRRFTLELGADWIHGTQSGDGPANPIYELALKHGLDTRPNDYRGSISG